MKSKKTCYIKLKITEKKSTRLYNELVDLISAIENMDQYIVDETELYTIKEFISLLNNAT